MERDNIKFLLIVSMIGLFILIGIFIVKAEVQSLGIFKQNECVELSQVCSNCTYVNLTRVEYPNSTKSYFGKYMTKKGTSYNYTFCSTENLGTYLIATCGDVDGEETCVVYDFQVTFNGNEKPTGIVIVFFSIGFLIVIGFLAYMFIYNLGHFIQMDYDLGDLIKNISAYFVLIGLYLLEIFYMGNEMINNIMVWIIGITGFTNVGIAFLAFIICFLAKQKVKIENAW
jgi:hypothetical protein